MLRSTTIAQCLVNSGMVKSLEEAEEAVRIIFDEAFPNKDFSDWNKDLDDTAAEDIIKNVGRASRINVRKLIENLWPTEDSF
jgi:hypothetical protein